MNGNLSLAARISKPVEDIWYETNPDEKQCPHPTCRQVVTMKELPPRSMHDNAPHGELKDNGEQYPVEANVDRLT